MASRNPALNDQIFQREIQANQQGAFTPGWGSPADELPPGVFGQPSSTGVGPGGPVAAEGGTMRLGGTVSATAILLLLLVVAGWFGWQQVTVTEVGVNPDGTVENSVAVAPWVFAAVIVGFLIAIVTVFKPKIARFTGPLYAIAEGLFIGAISHVFDAQWPGIVVQAVLLTFAVFAIMLVLFATGTIRVTEKLRMAVIASTLAIAVVYLISFVLSFFGSGVPMIHDAGPVGIGFSLLVVGIASFNLLLDFDFVQRGVAARAPRYMEWYAAFGLMVTLVWLYLEILRLLAKLRER